MPRQASAGGNVLVGVLTLDTSFQRFPGDIGSSDGLPFPVIHETLPGITARAATESDADILSSLVASSRRLVERGASVVTTSCGFLVTYQEALADIIPVPVVTSSLVQIPLLARVFPRDSRFGVLTFNHETLSPRHLAACGAPRDTLVAGLPLDGAFRRDVLGGAPSTSEERLEDSRAAMRSLLGMAPDVGAVVVECTNIVPYSATLAAEFSLPVFDLISALKWVTGGFAPRGQRKETVFEPGVQNL